MNLPKNVWDQVRAKTADEIIAALERDGFRREGARGAVLSFRHPDGRRVAIHYHPRKTYGPKLLRKLLDDIGWSVDDMRRLKLIK